MSEVTITVDDAAVRRLLDRLPSRIDTAMRLAMKDATTHIRDQMTTYPPPPDPIQGPASRPVRFTTRAGVNVRFVARSRGWSGGSYRGYVRTNTLKGSWHVTVTGSGLGVEGRIYSSGAEAPYNRYVQDADHQAQVHQGRWTNTIQNVSARSTDAVNEMFRARIAAAMR